MKFTQAVLCCGLVLLLTGCRGADRSGSVAAAPAAASQPLRLVVMDPLAGPLACDCVQGYAQRQYGQLALFLQHQLGRPVLIAYAESLESATARSEDQIHLIIGKQSVVQWDAGRLHLAVRPIARLTGKDGGTEQAGLFVVTRDDPARSIADLRGRRILFGPPDSSEKHSAALDALREAGVPVPAELTTVSTCSVAAIALVEKQADAAVISSYAEPLLEGCGAVEKGELRVIGRTRPVPFITAFVTAAVKPPERQAILDALLAARTDAKLLEVMESRSGFVPLGDDVPPPVTLGWTDWRGPRRDALSDAVPDKLPATVNILWQRSLTGQGLSGLAATIRHVVVADKDEQAARDIWRCLDADAGREIWRIEYPAAGKMDYTNSPRATPVIHDGSVYLLGAFGDLHCVELETGRIIWHKNIIREFGATLPNWGMTSTPLVVDGRLIVNPGAKDAALVALDCRTGQLLWKSPGEQAAYASFIRGEFGGARQIVGYDSISLGGWDPADGRRLWTLLPGVEGDFNVPTPLAVNRELLVATENNGTRLYGFSPDAAVQPTPRAHSRDLKPDTVTPVVLDGLVFGYDGDLRCLDARNGLKVLWTHNDETFGDCVFPIAGRGRVLLLTGSGELLLIRADRTQFAPISRLRLFADETTEIWSHPALVGDRLYVRNRDSIRCVSLRMP